VADDLEGDPTARLAGRLTVNPIRHLDPFGTVMIVLVGFGWGKPVPMTTSKLRNRRFGAAVVGFAGPAVNVILAIAAAAVYGREVNLFNEFSLTNRILSSVVTLNILLAILNLLPIPPLDGSRILSAVLPPEHQQFIYFLDQYGFLILLLAALFVLPPIFTRITPHIATWLVNLVG
jgi:Zn-dependent protease